ncbi:hypothetical protein [Pectobacterium brasiliense]|uniref:hypothetical protein n=1 Tax=Pectobacterium brasiliense TaxID=180957 RepID=UPI001968D5BC|nr:hypothetical protein [Pectobacterium brasiliense]MBN3265406.1 hypothetical protein [Pectobacterium brasiliense]
MGWIGVDLDGTLAQYKSGQGSAIGKPVPQMAKRVTTWCNEKKEVRIFTARAETLKGKRDVERWLKDNGFPALMVTNIKDSAMSELWDDKAIRVVKNSGQPCKGCAGNSQFHHTENQSFLTNC